MATNCNKNRFLKASGKRRIVLLGREMDQL
jgi:hypothetical protein